MAVLVTHPVLVACSVVSVVGIRGEMDFVNGLYDKIAGVNGRVAYKVPCFDVIVCC